MGELERGGSLFYKNGEPSIGSDEGIGGLGELHARRSTLHARRPTLHPRRGQAQFENLKHRKPQTRPRTIPPVSSFAIVAAVSYRRP